MAVLVEKLMVMMMLRVAALMATAVVGGSGLGDCGDGVVDDGLTPLPRLQDLHLERGLLWPREAAKPIEAPSVKKVLYFNFNGSFIYKKRVFFLLLLFFPIVHNTEWKSHCVIWIALPPSDCSLSS